MPGKNMQFTAFRGEAVHLAKTERLYAFCHEITRGVPFRRLLFSECSSPCGESSFPLAENGLMSFQLVKMRHMPSATLPLAGAWPFRRGKGAIGDAAARRGGPRATTAPGAGREPGRAPGEMPGISRDAAFPPGDRRLSGNGRTFVPSAEQGPPRPTAANRGRVFRPVIIKPFLGVAYGNENACGQLYSPQGHGQS